MSLPEIVTREQWLAARLELLAREKEATRQYDALNADRRRLPMVRVDKDYVFEGVGGNLGLLDMFAGKRQLVLQHVMFDPAWTDACPGCTAALDEINDGLLRHLAARETAFAAVSRAPLAKLENYRARRAWTFPWHSSFGNDFNYDFAVTIDPEKGAMQYNYRGEAELRAAGLNWIVDEPREMGGVSCFLRDGDQVFHTYSTFGRGAEQMGGGYSILDITALGRQEEWEEPKGRAPIAHPDLPFFEPSPVAAAVPLTASPEPKAVMTLAQQESCC